MGGMVAVMLRNGKKRKFLVVAHKSFISRRGDKVLSINRINIKMGRGDYEI